MGSSINSVRNTHTPVPGGFLRQASFRAFVGTLLFLLPVLAAVAEWPTYRHDNARSGQTPESLPPTELGPAWHWKSLRPPLPAWAGPAKWDAYNDIPRLNSMRNYDAALHTTVGGGKVYLVPPSMIRFIVSMLRPEHRCGATRPMARCGLPPR